MKYCKVCGNQVKETDKFCSQCGSKLEFEETFVESLSTDVRIIKLKICDLCGEENNFNSDECEYCGAGFTGKEKVIEREIKQQDVSTKIETSKKTSPEKKKEKSKPQRIKKSEDKSQSHPKKLETKQIFLISAVIVIIGAILIYYGIENSKIEKKNEASSQVQTENSPRIDLNAINEINRLEAELKNNPDDPEKLLKLAHLNHDSGFFEKAISYYEKYLSFRPEDNDAEVDLGVCYFELKQYDKATSIFEAVIQKNPKHQIAYLNLGIVNLTQGKIVEAKEYFQKCIALGEHTDAGHRAAELLKSHN